MKHICLIGLGFVLLFSACRKNIDDTIIDTTIPNPEIIRYTDGDVFGRIVNESGDVLTGVSVSLNDTVVITDDNGFFFLRNQLLKETGAYLTAFKSGYFQGSRTFVPVEGEASRVQITLLERTIVGSFEAASGGTVDVPGGGSLTFQQAGIVNLSGQDYLEEVQVAAKWINPADPNFADQMPGDLRAIDTEGDLQVLSTFGMFVVELQDPSGNVLGLKEGKKATISMPVPPAMQSLAPDTIPLWYFDEAAGIWLEEGSASLEGNMYVGEVAHFTFWNVDWPYPFGIIDGQFVTESGDVLPGLKVSIYIEGQGGFGQMNSNEMGSFAGTFLLGEVWTIKATSVCGDVLYEEEVGPFFDDASLGQLVIPDQFFATVSGNVVDCNGLPITSGYVLYEGDYSQGYLISSDGSFSFTYPFCDQSDFGISALDFTSMEVSSTQYYSFDSNVDVDTLTACGALPDPPYISILVNNRSYYWTNDSIQGEYGIIDLAKQIDGTSFGLPVQATQVQGEFANQINPEEMAFELVFPAQGVASDLSEAYMYITCTEDENGPYIFEGLLSFSELNITVYDPFPGGIIRGDFQTVIPVGPEVPTELNITCQFAVFRE